MKIVPSNVTSVFFACFSLEEEGKVLSPDEMLYKVIKLILIRPKSYVFLGRAHGEHGS